MSEMKYTKGPWYWEYSEGLRKRLTSHGSDVFTAALTESLNESYVDIDEADAHLIAAAPTLLEALQDAIEWFSKLKDWSGVGDPDIEKYRAAIRKAKGEE